MSDARDIKDIADGLQTDLQSITGTIQPTEESLRRVLGNLSRLVVLASWHLTKRSDQDKIRFSNSDKVRPSEQYLIDRIRS